MKRSDIDWRQSPDDRSLGRLRRRLGEDAYRDQVAALQDFLLSYFTVKPTCDGKLGDSISPMGATSKGGKILKVRWALPGGGKSGGVRLAIVAYCPQKKVVAAGVWDRRDNPDHEFREAAERLQDEE